MMSYVLLLSSLDVLPMFQTCLVLNEILDSAKALCFDSPEDLANFVKLRKL